MPLSDVFNLSSCPVSEDESEAGVLQHSLNLESSAVTITDLAAWGRMALVFY